MRGLPLGLPRRRRRSPPAPPPLGSLSLPPDPAPSCDVPFARCCSAPRCPTTPRPLPGTAPPRAAPSVRRLSAPRCPALPWPAPRCPAPPRLAHRPAPRRPRYCDVVCPVVLLRLERLVGPQAPGETYHIVIDHGGNVPYWEGQSYGVIPPNPKKPGSPNTVRLCSIASTRYGDSFDGRTASLCVRRTVYYDPETGKEDLSKKGICSNFLCDSKLGDKVQITGYILDFRTYGLHLILEPLALLSVSLTQARNDMSELDEDSDGFLQPHEMEAYIRGLIPNLAQLRDMLSALVQMYCRIAARKLFFCDPHRRGKACIKKVLLSNCLQELMELHQESEEEVTDTEQAENWFSLT
ncbi:hypothetical protein ABZP36_027203 [Zizania latifolia]